jgi:hypothetical protein
MERGRTGKADADPPGFTARRSSRGGGGVLYQGEDRAGLFQQRFAGLGQRDAARLPPKQLHLELGLERPDLSAERRLLDAEARRRPRDMTFLGDNDEVTKVPQLHRFDTFLIWVTPDSYIGQAAS